MVFPADPPIDSKAGAAIGDRITAPEPYWKFMTTSQNSQQIDAVPFSTLNERLQKAVKSMGFLKPTPVQASVIPAGLKGRDLLACAQTGSGKTAAFLLPVLNRLLESQEADKIAGKRFERKTSVLIIAPTRELAAQINEHFSDLSRFTNLSGAAIFGGVGMGPQERAFRSGVDVIAATPGRLLDHFSRGYANLEHLKYLILDEADRMLDMGFLPDIRKVLAQLPKTPRQTMLFSATMPEPILKLADTLLKNPFSINLERPPMVAGGIEHVHYPVPDILKQHLLYKMLSDKTIQTAIIFTRTKHRANRLAEFLSERKIKCDTIHANRRQAQRTKALNDFKSGAIRILVATDIAARGIDVEALSHVINFDVPHLPDDYIHRSGRTARANMKGIACTLVSPGEIIDFRRIENHIGMKIRRVTLEDFDYSARPKEALEIPLGVRLAAHRAKRADERARAAKKQGNKTNSPKPQKSKTGNGERTNEAGEAQPPRKRYSKPSGPRKAPPSTSNGQANDSNRHPRRRRNG